LTGCDTGGGGGGGGGGGTRAESTWQSNDGEIISLYNDSSFVISQKNKQNIRGTYNVTARSVFADIGMTVKEIHGDYMTEEMDVQGLNFDKKWYNKNQIIEFLRSWLKKNGIDSYTIEQAIAEASPMLDLMFTEIQGTINDDNTMTIAGDTYTKTSGTVPGGSKPGGTNPGTNPGTGGSKKWTPVTYNPFGNSYINAIAYGGGKFVAGGDKMAYSSDGVTWTAVSDSKITVINAIAYDGSKFIAGGASGKMATSSDGVTWTAVGDSKLSGYIQAIAYSNGKYIAGDSTGKMATSTNGTTWTAATTSNLTGEIQAIVGNGTTFVAVTGSYGGNMAYSSDGGSTWTAVDVKSTFGTSSNQFDGKVIAFGNGKFVICTSSASNNGKMWTSTNGSTWTAAGNSPFGLDFPIEIIAYGNNKFVALGHAYSSTVTSTDGTNWKAVNDNDKSFFGGSIDAIAYGGGKFVAVGSYMESLTNYPGRIAYLSD